MHIQFSTGLLNVKGLMITWACLQVFSSLCCIFVLKRKDPPDGDGATSVTQQITDETMETDDATKDKDEEHFEMRNDEKANEKTHLTQMANVDNDMGTFQGDTLNNVYGWTIMKSTDFWLLMGAFIIGGSLSRVNHYNIGTYLRSFREEKHLNIITSVGPWLLITFKLFIGCVSDLYVEKVSRTIFLVICAVANAVLLSCFIFLADNIGLFYVTAFVAYISKGLYFLIAPVLIAEYFGVKYFGINYGAAFFADGCFTLLLQVILGIIYDANVSDVATHTCYGLHCYYVSSGILCALSMVTLVAVVVLHIRRPKRTS